MLKIYIAGPYTQGDVAVNVREALAIATVLVKQGLAPYVPHLTHFWDLLAPQPYETWLQLDLVWLAQCDAVVRIPGPSWGADAEVAYAQEHGIPVYLGVAALIDAIIEGAL
jgi:nucleoside 2-deoxyribosyltransferase